MFVTLVSPSALLLILNFELRILNVRDVGLAFSSVINFEF
jgi:hypothetical protein